MNQGVGTCSPGTVPQELFKSAITHEFGHTLGFRHSDQDRGSSGPCSSDPSLECSNQAIMKSFISTGLNAALQAWDQHAVQAVYPGNVCAPSNCTAPVITSQPASSTAPANSDTTLSIAATGTGPLSYQWYIGTSGNTASPVSGATGPAFIVAPATTTSYWIRVSNSCGSVNSVTATVTVTAAAGSGSSFYLITPCRLLDTRDPAGAYGGPALAANAKRNVVVTGRCGVPAGAQSIALNVTVISANTIGYFTLFPGPASTATPNTATINFTTGKTRGNNAIIRLGSDGSMNINNSSSTAEGFVIDLTGYFK
jgi:hypothetical protein